MNKLHGLADTRSSKQEDADENAPVRHCIILTLIGLAAIAVSIALPPDENAPAPKVSIKPESAVQHAAPASGVEPTASAFDDVPMQDPATPHTMGALRPAF